MDTIKAGRPLIELVKLCHAASSPLLLAGSHGVGKSELLQQAACEMRIGCIVRDLSIMEPTDLTGLPKAKGATTTYLTPEFLPRQGQGLLVIEELNRAERYMRAPCLQLLSARRLNDYVLPPGWLPVAAVNPPDEEYQVDELDPALLSRFTQVRVVPDRKQWLEWARRRGIHPAVLAYVESDDTVFNGPDSNPRSWTQLSDLLRAADKQGAEPSVVRAAVFGKVGDVRGKAILASLKKVERPLSAADVLTAYPKHQDQVKRWITEGHLDLVQTTLRALYLYIQPEGEYLDVRKHSEKWRNLGRFMADMPGDIRQDASKVFSERGYEFPRRLLPRKAPPTCLT